MEGLYVDSKFKMQSLNDERSKSKQISSDSFGYVGRRWNLQFMRARNLSRGQIVVEQLHRQESDLTIAKSSNSQTSLTENKLSENSVQPLKVETQPKRKFGQQTPRVGPCLRSPKAPVRRSKTFWEKPTVVEQTHVQKVLLRCEKGVAILNGDQEPIFVPKLDLKNAKLSQKSTPRLPVARRGILQQNGKSPCSLCGKLLCFVIRICSGGYNYDF
eukprot:TRINITY_DN1347_c0_g1_i1.p3 TRINITY_DN1347_c0_g1~~TRINITY_DN1347_c0_g1_i1.p3  ORF type:complete len:215 (+),score=22.64 TRINITY_DN1347_c0_g1_i1:277-921(+)